MFDATMRKYDDPEVCELVELFILYDLSVRYKKKKKKKMIGLY